MNDSLLESLMSELETPEVLKDFDDFFVGGGSALKREVHVQDLSSQIMAKPLSVIKVRSDLARFVQERIEVLDYQDLYICAKKKAYDLFNYFTLKSQQFNTPMSEADLVFGVEDGYVLESLKTMKADYYSVFSVATLTAYMDMGIRVVKFVAEDGCDLCKSCNGVFLDSMRARDLILTGNGPTHTCCACRYMPIIDRSQKYVLDTVLNIQGLNVGAKQVFNVPIELKAELIPYIEKVDQDLVEFRDLSAYGKGVVFEEDGVLLVHNNYCGNVGPLEFLAAYLEMLVLECPKTGTSFYFKGHNVVESQGFYWDTTTKERVL